MKAVDQTTFGQPEGNCFSACVASLLEIPISDVPYFMGHDDWFENFAEWLRPYGFYPMMFNAKDNPTWSPEGWAIAGGQSPRGPHSVVSFHDKIRHDPHPSRDRIAEVEDWTVFVAIDPAERLRPEHAGA